ncbi:MAG: hypothetical protein EBS36_01340 [Actinobacteria bacterium]|nr:hypothetical protein [Actinomycetota bacterium]
MKLKKLVPALVAVFALSLSSASGAFAQSTNAVTKSGHGHKVAITSQEAITAYQTAVLTFTAAKAAADAAPTDKVLAKAAKRSAKEMKKSYRIARTVIAKNFHKAVRDAKKAYRAAVKGRKDQADVVAAAKAAKELAIAQATTTRDSDMTLLKSLRPTKP